MVRMSQALDFQFHADHIQGMIFSKITHLINLWGAFYHSPATFIEGLISPARSCACICSEADNSRLDGFKYGDPMCVPSVRSPVRSNILVVVYAIVFRLWHSKLLHYGCSDVLRLTELYN
jgi:hypothetical protein